MTDHQKKASVCIVMNGNNLLVLKRADGCSYHNKWCLPGGRAENSETAVETMFREVEEETGIHLAKTTFLCSYDNPRLHLAVFFSTTDTQDVVVQESEISDYEWVDMSKYEGGIDLPPMTDNILNEIGAHFKQYGEIHLDELKASLRQ